MEGYLIALISWTKLKFRLESKPHKSIVYFREREIWWASLGLNIGSEQHGKHGNFERPVLIVKKFNKSTLWIIPLTKQYKVRDYFLNLVDQGLIYNLNLSQLRLISSKRLLRKINKLSELEFHQVKESIKKLL